MINGGLGLLLLGGGTWAYFMVSSGGTTPAQAASSNTRTVAVAQGTVTATVTADGSVESAATMSADFTTSGRVTEIDVKVGDVVGQGQVLAKVDASDAQDALDAAKANLSAARAALTRANDTGNADSIANAQNNVDRSQSSVDTAQRKVDGTILKAPMAGTIVALTGAVGGSSSGSSSGTQSSAKGFIQLADLTKLQVAASVPEADATRLAAGQTATVSWNALTSAKATGKVTAISPTASSGNTVKYPITVALDTIPEGVRLGQTVSLVVTVGEAQDAIYVPAAAVRTANGRSTVTVVANGKQEARTVEIGLKGDTNTVITSGLELGEMVVLTVTSTTGTTNQQFPGGGVFPGGGGFTGGGTGQRPGGGGTR